MMPKCVYILGRVQCITNNIMREMVKIEVIAMTAQCLQRNNREVDSVTDELQGCVVKINYVDGRT